MRYQYVGAKVALRQEHKDALPWREDYHNNVTNLNGLHHLVVCCIWVCSRGYGRQPRVREGDYGVAATHHRVLQPLAPVTVPPVPPGPVRLQHPDLLLQFADGVPRCAILAERIDGGDLERTLCTHGVPDEYRVR